MTLLCSESSARTSSSFALRPSSFPVPGRGFEVRGLDDWDEDWVDYASTLRYIARRHDLLFFTGNGGSGGVQGSFFPNQIAEVETEMEMEAVTEEQLATLFVTCGQIVVDCQICGDPNSVLHFSFIEFTDEEGAVAALSLAGTMLGFYHVRVLPSKTAIAPVNPSFLPRTDDECKMCARTIYCTNIDKKVAQADVKIFFESICGEVSRLRLLGDYHHSTSIAFVEFVMVSTSLLSLSCGFYKWLANLFCLLHL
ncbi:polyadenylate-binding protein-interacting protein 11-like [Humulus lupulus]|uniref:polyadenylate-binding protein-interacting protein 11-like n=1 Tax=Humulus lupulus TaxID=3486 RepID=UPI002B4106BE|nr:polyadenylate-binding protein-interacting protein 11-like [Humulus lupulus]